MHNTQKNLFCSESVSAKVVYWYLSAASICFVTTHEEFPEPTGIERKPRLGFCDYYGSTVSCIQEQYEATIV